MPDEPAEPVVPSPCFFTARGPWVRPSPGIPCALSSDEGELRSTARTDFRRENVEVCVGKCSPHAPLSCPASSGASSIPETAALEPIRRGVLDRPVKPGDDNGNRSPLAPLPSPPILRLKGPPKIGPLRAHLAVLHPRPARPIPREKSTIMTRVKAHGLQIAPVLFD